MYYVYGGNDNRIDNDKMTDKIDGGMFCNMGMIYYLCNTHN